tara:strand:- start:1074 stop:1907 length:834 start_codon:yes stop_codon:yes gene_type:complete
MMSQYAEDYDDMPVDDSTDIDSEIQDGAESYEADSDPPYVEASEEEQEVDNSEGRQVTDRQLYARYGEINQKYQSLENKMDSLLMQNQQLQAQQMQQPQQQQQSGLPDSSVYNDMDANQREAADKIVSQHPIVKGLLEERDQRQNQQQMYAQQQEQAYGQQLQSQKQEFYGVMDGVRKQFGDEIAEDVTSELEDTAELVGWNLENPSFQRRLKKEVRKLGKLDKSKRNNRQRVSSERGSARGQSSGIPTALKKGADGKPYFDWESSVDEAIKMSRRK